MKTTVHAAAGASAMLGIRSFRASTGIAELFPSPQAVVAVKQATLNGMCVLAPAVAPMAVTGGSGLSLAGSRAGRLVEGKKKRVRLIALNGKAVP